MYRRRDIHAIADESWGASRVPVQSRKVGSQIGYFLGTSKGNPRARIDNFSGYGLGPLESAVLWDQGRVQDDSALVVKSMNQNEQRLLFGNWLPVEVSLAVGKLVGQARAPQDELAF